MAEFKNIALVRNIMVDTGDIACQVYEFLLKRGCIVMPESSCKGAWEKQAKQRFYSFDELAGADLAIVIGGDGTLLNTARTFAPKHVPIVGINLGRLGFLVDVLPKKLIETLTEILDGQYTTEERFLLNAKIIRDDKVIEETLAVNDVVINNDFKTRMIEFFTHIDDHYVNHERADGIIIATPTGSTAYSLSAGGPILHPSLNAITLVPICPHTLNHRPLVIDSSVNITIGIDPECRTPAQVSFDGQVNFKLQAGDRVSIDRSNINIKLLHPLGYEFFDILRAKLRWGKQPDEGTPR